MCCSLVSTAFRFIPLLHNMDVALDLAATSTSNTFAKQVDMLAVHENVAVFGHTVDSEVENVSLSIPLTYLLM